MSFLYPIFLAGGLAIALPIIFHLIRRSTRDKVPFSTIRFLEASPPRLTKKSRLEHLWLLLLRCLILLLLAAAFARPYIEQAIDPSDVAENPQRNILLIDTSASMQRDGAWDRVQALVSDILADIDNNALASAYAFDMQLRPLVTFEQWNSAPTADRPVQIINRVDQTEPTWKATHLGNALLTAVDLLEESTRIGENDRDNQDWRIHVIGDLQTGMLLDGIQGFEWPKGCQVSFHQVEVPDGSNVGIHAVPNLSTYASMVEAENGRVRISNAGDSRSETFSFGWIKSPTDSQLTGKTEIYLPPGKSRVVDVPEVADNFAPDVLRINGDDHPFDNVAYRVPLRARQSKVLCLGTQSGDQRTQLNYYLQKAFQQTTRHVVSVEVLPADQPLLDSALEDTRLIVISSPLAQDLIDQVRAANAGGVTVLIPLHRADLQETLQAVIGDPAVTYAPSNSNRYALFSKVDFQHPLFSSFADPRFSDFTKIQFWSHMTLDIEGNDTARVLATFDSLSPAIVEFPHEAGSVFVTAFGWQPKLSQFALSTKFVPFLYGLLDLGAGIHEVKSHYVVGQEVDLSSLTDHEQLSITTPQSETIEISADTKAFRQSDTPGIYTINSSSTPIRFAVNLHPSESLTGPILEETLMGLGIPMDQQRQAEAVNPIVEAAQKKQEAEEIESSQKFWRYIILATLIFATFETWIAGRLSRHSLASA